MKKKILDKANFPSDLKKLDSRELKRLCAEIREFIIENVSVTGGHLASSLGVVEIAVALHYCLDAPTDKIIWDVGHQSYAHKILTGRKDKFASLRKRGGLSGFPKPAESEYDSFVAGHASTGVSVAAGFAAARNLNGGDYGIAVVIGDGSTTGGLAYEGLNNLGALGERGKGTLVILNDNQMSISKNVGAMSKALAKYLSDIRTAKGYLGAKRGVKKLLGKTRAGRALGRFITGAKEGVKTLLVPGKLFEELGFTYIGPVDGHDLDELIRVIKNCSAIDSPVLLHVVTTKGKGYAPAERDPDKFHGVCAFDAKTGVTPPKAGRTLTDVFAEKIVSAAEKDKSVVCVTAAMADGVGLSAFAEKFPTRFFDVGIAESHAATFCAGLAAAGKRPVFAVYSTFLQRAYDQILHDVCIQNLPVVFAIDRAGVVGEDGETHQGAFDMAYLAHIPNVTVLAPRDGAELTKTLDYALTVNKPVAIRYPKALDERAVPNNDPAAEIAVVSVGALYARVVAAQGILRGKGVAVNVFDALFVKPIDGDLVERLLKYKRIYTAEEGVKIGGFGERLNALLAERDCRVDKIFALPDRFIEQGERGEILDSLGFSGEGIAFEILRRESGGKSE